MVSHARHISTGNTIGKICSDYGRTNAAQCKIWIDKWLRLCQIESKANQAENIAALMCLFVMIQGVIRAYKRPTLTHKWETQISYFIFGLFTVCKEPLNIDAVAAYFSSSSS